MNASTPHHQQPNNNNLMYNTTTATHHPTTQVIDTLIRDNTMSSHSVVVSFPQSPDMHFHADGGHLNEDEESDDDEANSKETGKVKGAGSSNGNGSGKADAPHLPVHAITMFAPLVDQGEVDNNGMAVVVPGASTRLPMASFFFGVRAYMRI